MPKTRSWPMLLGLGLLAITQAAAQTGPAAGKDWQAYNNEAVRLSRERDWKGSAAAASQALELLEEQTQGKDSPATATVLTNLGLALARGSFLNSEAKAQLGQAVSHLQRALRMQKRLHGPTSAEAGQAELNLGNAYNQSANKQPELALQHYRNFLAIEEQRLGADSLELVGHMVNVAAVALEAKHYDTHEALQIRALQIREKRLGPDDASLAQNLQTLATLHQILHDFDGARPYLERAYMIRDKALGPGHADTVSTLDRILRLLREKANHAKVLAEHLKHQWQLPHLPAWAREGGAAQSQAPVALNAPRIEQVALNARQQHEQATRINLSQLIDPLVRGDEILRLQIVLSSPGQPADNMPKAVLLVNGEPHSVADLRSYPVSFPYSVPRPNAGMPLELDLSGPAVIGQIVLVLRRRQP